MSQVLGMLREVEARGLQISLAEELRLQGPQFRSRRSRILAAYRDEMERAHGI